VGTGDISTCTVDPFAAACVAANSTFATYLADAQAKRYDYCSVEGVSDTDPLCASFRACDTALNANTAVPAGCGVNFDSTLRDTCAATPFDPQCARDIFDSDKRDFCSTNDVTNLFHANCTADYRDDTARNTFCEGNPFDTNCDENVAYADEREENCASGSPDAKCVRPGLNAAAHPVDIPTNNMQSKFRDSFLNNVTLRDNGTLATIKGIATITEMMDDPNAEPDADPVPQITTTRTEDRTATVTGNIIIGRRGGAVGPDGEPNTNPDGYAIFKLIRQGDVAEADRTSQHSAILSTTNLGAPLTSAPTIAIWPGHFITGNNTTTIAPTPIAVDFYINFTGNGGTLGFINTARDGIGANVVGGTDDRPAAVRAPGVHLGATFNAAGIMGGFVSLDDLRGNNALHVYGLIGQEGFVATFTDVNNQTGKFGAITA
nr:hypothetical protein [Pseudomonadota bacterium]